MFDRETRLFFGMADASSHTFSFEQEATSKKFSMISFPIVLANQYIWMQTLYHSLQNKKTSNNYKNFSFGVIQFELDIT